MTGRSGTSRDSCRQWPTTTVASVSAAAAPTSVVLPMPASPVTRSSPEPASRWWRTTPSSGDAASDRHAGTLGHPGCGRGEPQPVEPGDVTSHRPDQHLDGAPAWERRRRQRFGDRGVGNPCVGCEVPQARPSGTVVQGMERINQLPAGTGSQMRSRQRSHLPRFTQRLRNVHSTPDRSEAPRTDVRIVGHEPPGHLVAEVLVEPRSSRRDALHTSTRR